MVRFYAKLGNMEENTVLAFKEIRVSPLRISPKFSSNEEKTKRFQAVTVNSGEIF